MLPFICVRKVRIYLYLHLSRLFCVCINKCQKDTQETINSFDLKGVVSRWKHWWKQDT